MGIKIIAKNRKASHDYEFNEFFTAGMQLQGTEVKSLRDGKMSFGDAFCLINNEELFVKNLHISEYMQGNIYNHHPTRERKLLMKKREIIRLGKKMKEKGFTLVPTKIFFSESGYAKLEIALAKGKKAFDKRESLKQKDAKKQIRHLD